MAAPIWKIGRVSRRCFFLPWAVYFRRHKHANSWKGAISYDQSHVEVGNSTLTFTTGKYARFADGAAVAKLGDTSVLVTAVSQKQSSASFLPLIVDYRQKAAAAGRIPTNYFKRELGPSEHEILTSRVIDRSMRPAFPAGYFLNTQLVCNLLAVDGINDPDIISINAASAALAVSDIPWYGPVAAVRVGLVDDEVVINPTRKQLQKSSLNIIMTGASNKKIVMLDGEADRVPPNKVQHALSCGLEATEKIIKSIENLQNSVGKDKRELEALSPPPEHLVEAIQSYGSTLVKDILFNDDHDKISRDKALRMVGEKVASNVKESFPDEEDAIIYSCYQDFVKRTFRDLILDEDRRCDGRGLKQLRDISCQVDLFEPLHGSAIFQRGQTQVLCTVTFDSLEAAAKSDPVSQIIGRMKEKNFMLHYEFPPYATNEIKGGGQKRREFGHGALAERGLKAIVPAHSDFTMRLTAEVLESNGSSSMASVCSGSLALMDAGVSVKEAAAGVAIGLVTRTDPDTGDIEKHKILTDLLGIEDYMGDMDFKMAATATGLTAIQADIKLQGIPFFVVSEAFENGFEAIQSILGIMNVVISSPRDGFKECGPVTEKMTLDFDKQTQLTRLGGLNIRRIQSETGITMTRLDDNSFQIFAPNSDALSEAKEIMETIFNEQSNPVLEFGAIYKCKIMELRDYGAMVQIHPQMKPLLLHNSQLDQRKVSHASSLGFKVGDEITVKYFGRDPSSGQHRISRKVLQGPPSPFVKDLN